MTNFASPGLDKWMHFQNGTNVLSSLRTRLLLFLTHEEWLSLTICYLVLFRKGHVWVLCKMNFHQVSFKISGNLLKSWKQTSISFILRPTVPHAQAQGPTNFLIKIFQLERHKLKINEKIIDSLSNFHLPIQYLFLYLLCKFHMVPPKVHQANPYYFILRWRMPPSLLCFGHVDWIAIC